MREHTYTQRDTCATTKVLRDFSLKQRIAQVAWINKEARLMYFNRRSILLGTAPDRQARQIPKNFTAATLNRRWYIIETNIFAVYLGPWIVSKLAIDLSIEVSATLRERDISAVKIVSNRPGKQQLRNVASKAILKGSRWCLW